MANKQLFQSPTLVRPADARNEAGGRAYALQPKHALAQYAATGCLNSTFYASAETQLQTVLDLCRELDAEFLAKTAVYCRERGFMKDMPALLCAVLATKSPALLRAVFPRVIDDGRMLRNFVQILRSGQTGRKSLGTAPKRLVQGWFAARTPEQIFRASVGQDPSLADVVKMVHPHPTSAEHEALFAWLIGREGKQEALPAVVTAFETYKRTREGEPPDVPFQMLTALELDTAAWVAIARRASWQQTRMNLNTFARHGVFEVEGMADLVAARLRDEAAICLARVFPYQLLMAWKAADTGIPSVVREALHAAMEVATRNVPELPGKVYVFPDVSGSMRSPVTGQRAGGTSRVRCVDVAALIAAAVLRRNPTAEVIPFEQKVCSVELDPALGIMENAERLAAIGGGGTNCSAPLALLNQRRAEGDLLIYASDNESWVDQARGRGTATMEEWQRFKARNPRARMVCIDLQPYRTVQATHDDEILNVGGFSDQVFEVMAAFAQGSFAGEQWVRMIEETAI